VKPFGEGFWVCATGACDSFADRKDGDPYEDARRLLDDFDDFHPNLLKGIPPATLGSIDDSAFIIQ
jgi:hypothetical protein